jgi:hypothetical protein
MGSAEDAEMVGAAGSGSCGGRCAEGLARARFRHTCTSPRTAHHTIARPHQRSQLEELYETEGLVLGLYHHLWKKNHRGECCPLVRVPHTVSGAGPGGGAPGPPACRAT